MTTSTLRTDWQWQDKGVWMSYTDADARQLENALNNKDNTLHLHINKWWYSINLTTLTQVNERTQTKRAIRRLETPSASSADGSTESKSGSPTGSLETKNDSYNAYLTDVPCTTDEFVQIANLFKYSLPKSLESG